MFPPPALNPLAGVQAVLGLLQTFASGWFHETIANFGPRADHTLRDVATFYFASAIALAIAANRPAWRTPVLFLVLAQYLLHAVNHLVDVGDADPGRVGPAPRADPPCFVRTDPAGNLKIDKEKSTEKVDGAVALVMALDRAMKNQGGESVYDTRGLLII